MKLVQFTSILSKFKKQCLVSRSILKYVCVCSIIITHFTQKFTCYHAAINSCFHAVSSTLQLLHWDYLYLKREMEIRHIKTGDDWCEVLGGAPRIIGGGAIVLPTRDHRGVRGPPPEKKVRGSSPGKVLKICTPETLYK